MIMIDEYPTPLTPEQYSAMCQRTADNYNRLQEIKRQLESTESSRRKPLSVD